MRRGAAGKPRARRSVAVLSPRLASGRAGAVVSGAVSAATERGARVVAVQTLGGGAEPPPEAPGFALPVAWDLVSGFLVVMNAVDRGHLDELRGTGKPVILVAPEAESLDWPVVEADSRGGTRLAVGHLVEHGHRRIGFAGCLSNPRGRERHAAYLEALAAFGIAPDPSLVFEAGGDGQRGGEAAARSLLAAGIPASAVLAATDANAIGLMTVLGGAGLQLPGDLAVVGFDDVSAPSSEAPALSTVHLSFEAVGRRAASLLIDMAPGRPAPARRHRVPTKFVPRESCGCTATTALRAAAHGDLFSSPEERLRLRLEQLLVEPGEGRRVDRSALDRAVRLLSAGPAPEGRREADLRRAAAALHAVNAAWSAVPAVIDCLHQYRREGGGHPEGAETGITRLAVELSRSVVEEEVSANETLRAEAARWFQVAMSLLGGSAGDPRSLGWLAQTGARAACLGLWSAEPAGESHKAHALRLTGTHVRDAGVTLDGPASMKVEAFPPRAILEDLDWDPGELAAVLPVRTRGMDLGLLAMVTALPADRAGDRDQLLETSALLSVAVEREVMVEWLHAQTEDLARAYKRERDLVAELRRREKQLRHSAQHDPLTGLPNRALFLDRLGQALARAGRREDARVALLFLDLDGFKDVNDNLGHLAGDRLLVAVAERISQRLRRSDTAARLGGDEFAVLLEDVSGPEAVAAIAADLTARVAAPFDVEGRMVTVSASVGMAVDGETPDDLLRRADAAMYAVKGAHHAAEMEVEVVAAGVLSAAG